MSYQQLKLLCWIKSYGRNLIQHRYYRLRPVLHQLVKHRVLPFSRTRPCHLVVPRCVSGTRLQDLRGRWLLLLSHPPPHPPVPYQVPVRARQLWATRTRPARPLTARLVVAYSATQKRSLTRRPTVGTVCAAIPFAPSPFGAAQRQPYQPPLPAPNRRPFPVRPSTSRRSCPSPRSPSLRPHHRLSPAPHQLPHRPLTALPAWGPPSLTPGSLQMLTPLPPTLPRPFPVPSTLGKSG